MEIQARVDAVQSRQALLSRLSELLAARKRLESRFIHANRARGAAIEEIKKIQAEDEPLLAEIAELDDVLGISKAAELALPEILPSEEPDSA